jgi:hypothetical protein
MRRSYAAHTYRDRRHRFEVVRQRPHSFVYYCRPCGRFSVDRRPLNVMYRFQRTLREVYAPIVLDEVMRPSAVYRLLAR